MSKNRTVKPVSFNLEKDKEMIKHISQFDNFSSYVKYLIVNDMNSNNKLSEIVRGMEDIKDILLKNEIYLNKEKNKNESDKLDNEQQSIINNILNL